MSAHSFLNNLISRLADLQTEKTLAVAGSGIAIYLAARDLFENAYTETLTDYSDSDF